MTFDLFLIKDYFSSNRPPKCADYCQNPVSLNQKVIISQELQVFLIFRALFRPPFINGGPHNIKFSFFNISNRQSKQKIEFFNSLMSYDSYWRAS